MSLPILDHAGATRAWRARWVGPAVEPNSIVHFRAVCPAAAADAVICIAAGSRYRLWVDGRLVGEGPPRSAVHQRYFDEHRLAGLAAGAVLAVSVHYAGFNEFDRLGLLCEVADAAGRVLLATGDDAWRCWLSPAWRRDAMRNRMAHLAVWQEHYDARAEPADWRLAGFDAGAWAVAAPVPEREAPWTPPVRRDIPAMAEDDVPAALVAVEEQLDLAVRLRPEDLSTALSAHGVPLARMRVEGAAALAAGTGPALVDWPADDGDYEGVYAASLLLDLGAVTCAYVELAVEGPAGAELMLGYAERLIDGRFNNAIECPLADGYILRGGGVETHRTWMWKAFRYLKVLCRGGTGGRLAIRALRLRRTRYPFAHDPALRCGDALLAQVFAACAGTLRLCCHEAIMDTPWREQAQWLGDGAGVTGDGLLTCFGDPRPVAKFLRQTIAQRLPCGLIDNISNRGGTVEAKQVLWAVPDFSLWWIIGVRDYWRRTGDRVLVAAAWPAVQGVLAFFARLRRADGLIGPVPYWLLIDWAPLDRSGACAALNALAHGALAAAGELAAVRGDAALGAEIAAFRQGIAAAFDGFWDAGAGIYRDGLAADGTRSAGVSEHTNMAAIAWGLCAPERGAAIVERLLGPAPLPHVEAQPFFASVTLAALARLDDRARLLAEIRRRWGGRMIARGATSAWEEWSQNGSRRTGRFQGFLRSHSHAWSAAPAAWLLRALAGVADQEPGRARIAPLATPWSWSLRLPLPGGGLAVAWDPAAGARVEPWGTARVEPAGAMAWQAAWSVDREQ